MPGNDLSPHRAMFQVLWSVHEVHPSGMVEGGSKDSGRLLLTLDGTDLALAKSKAINALETLKKAVKENGGENDGQ